MCGPHKIFTLSYNIALFRAFFVSIYPNILYSQSSHLYVRVPNADVQMLLSPL